MKAFKWETEANMNATIVFEHIEHVIDWYDGKHSYAKAYLISGREIKFERGAALQFIVEYHQWLYTP